MLSRARQRPWWLLALAACAPPAASVETQAAGMAGSRTQTAVELMAGFAERTGLSSERPQQRYLWTDAFAVCNLLGLARATGEERHRQLALRLVERVHAVLGRHRSDDPRSGWISGLGEREGALHPTRGGLRIGKPFPERGPEDRFDERLEWDRDGQYFHYLTRWMHALDLVARSTREPRFNAWARELAVTAHAAFSYAPPGGGRSRMFWKMSIDLRRPLVTSMGQHDPLDGLVTFVRLQTTARELGPASAGAELEAAIADLAAMVEAGELATADPLGLGGLLMDADRVQQLMGRGAFSDAALLEELLGAALAGVQRYARRDELERPARMRLAFRELGLAIGLHAARRMGDALGEEWSPEVRARLATLREYAPLAERIESFWLDPEHQRAPTWTEHRDIDEVMLATSLAPEGCSLLFPPD